MAMSNAEKVRAFRAREKQKKAAQARKPQAHVLADVFVSPFFEYSGRNANIDDFDQMFDMMGLQAPAFDDDSGPKSESGIFEANPELRESIYPDSARSLDRAELMIGCLLDAAATMAGIVRSYKRREIDARIDEVASGDLSNPDSKQTAVARIVALTKMREQLDKDVRWPLPQWKVERGVPGA